MWTSRDVLVYRAKNAPELTASQLDAAAREAVLLNADTRLQSAPVQDGRVYWVEDISKINRIQAQLAEINAQLSEENELIQAENELKRQRAQIEEKNRLMDEMIALVRASAASNQSASGAKKAFKSWIFKN